jgi:pyruvate dehydrogenase E2 component (dihydrolipoamide acetyltransferase)
MAEAVIMPRQGQSVESCIFSEWFIKKGEKVNQGDLLFAYETDKAAFEQEAPADGVLLATLAEEGDEIPVLQTIAVIGEEGESIEEFLSQQSVPQEPKQESEDKQDAASTEATVIEPQPSSREGATKISPRARKLASKSRINYEEAKGTGPEGRIIERDIQNLIENQPKATPLAKSISQKEHITMPSKGSGVGGKVLASDVRQAPSVTLAEDYSDKKISNIRKIIAENMYESLANTAQLTLHSSADARKILAARKTVKNKMAEGYKYNITINDMVSSATIKALIAHPDVNVHFLGDSIRYFQNVHLGFAVDTPRGLMVPTIKGSNHLTVEGLSSKMKELAESCQAGNIDPETLQGATFTITNLGGLGIEMFTPVLNPPQAGILGINTIKHEPAQLEDGTFGFIPKIALSLTFDHRALDGAPAARFLQTVVKEIEEFEL